MIVVVVMDSYTNAILRGPDIISRGFVYVRESEELISEAREAVRVALDECDLGSGSSEWSYYKTVIKDTLRDYLWKKTKRSPMILPVIMPVEL
jgi:ribonuclease J